MSEIHSGTGSRMQQRPRNWHWQAGTAVALLAIASCPASAANLTITCERSDVISASSGPTTFTYTGDAAGTLQVKAPYGDMSLPATLAAHAMADGTASRALKAFGDTTSRMPNLAALEACISTKIEQGQEGDADSYLSGRDACLAQTPPTSSPVPMTGQISIGIFPGEPASSYSVIVEMKRIYNEATKAPGGRTVIETFPGNCSLVEK